jgi:phospholipase C
MFLAWFTYDTARPPEGATAILGDPGHRWLTAQGPYSGDTATLTIYLTEGGVFDKAEPEASNDGIGDGTLTLEFADCTEGMVTYAITSLGISGEIPIQRIVPDNIPLCEALANP